MEAARERARKTGPVRWDGPRVRGPLEHAGDHFVAADWRTRRAADDLSARHDPLVEASLLPEVQDRSRSAGERGAALTRSWFRHAWVVRTYAGIALAEKGLPYREREIDLADKPPELLGVNPAGGVPVLVDDGGAAIPESLVILQDLEDRWPERPLLPPDPLGRARARLLLARITALLGPQLKLARGTDAEKAAAEAAVREALAKLEAELPPSDGGFLAGPFSIADIALAPFVAKLPERLRPGALGLPRLARWERAAMSRPSVVAHTAPRRAA
jgi:glutathione S-transferase